MRTWLAFVALSLTACSSSVPTVAGDMTAPRSDDFATACGGGPVMGAADDHCGTDAGYASFDTTQCMASGGTMAAYGATMYVTSGYDDACKYRVSYTVSPICIDKDITFVVVVKSAIDGSLVAGAAPTLEAFLGDESHPAKAAGTTDVLSMGAYRISGVELGEKGNWTVRFHLFPTCGDAPTSPKSTAAFYVESP